MFCFQEKLKIKKKEVGREIKKFTLDFLKKVKNLNLINHREEIKNKKMKGKNLV